VGKTKREKKNKKNISIIIIIFFISRLQEMIPSVAAKDNVTHLDIILEAIRYIDSLQDKLADKIERGEIVPLQVAGKRKRGEE